MCPKTYYVSQLGQDVFTTTDFDAYRVWCEEQPADRLRKFDFFTSDAEPACPDPDCDCRPDYGFSDDELEQLETVGVFV